VTGDARPRGCAMDVPADNLLLAVVDIPDGKHIVLLAGEALSLCQPGNRGIFMGTRPKGILVLDNKNRDKPPPALESARYRDAHILVNEKKALKKGGDNVWRMECGAQDNGLSREIVSLADVRPPVIEGDCLGASAEPGETSQRRGS
jgi:hypothetical protein